MLLCPSMMCAQYGNLQQEITSLEIAGVDIFHIDIMDGKFVPNFGMGIQDLTYICQHSNIPVDVHLMIESPSNYVNLFAELGASIIYVHPESEVHTIRTLQKIKSLGKLAGLALNPETSIDSIKPLLSFCDYLLIMSVSPGFAGQKYLNFIDDKIEQLLQLEGSYHYKVIIDGACSPEKVTSLSRKGVAGFVLGTSALFNKSASYSEIIANLRTSSRQ